MFFSGILILVVSLMFFVSFGDRCCLMFCMLCRIVLSGLLILWVMLVVRLLIESIFFDCIIIFFRFSCWVMLLMWIIVLWLVLFISG